MKLNASAFGLSGDVMSASFTICSLFVAVAPETTAELIWLRVTYQSCRLDRLYKLGELLGWSSELIGQDYGAQLPRRSTTLPLK